MTTTCSFYDSEQYLFELAQSFMRSRVIFTSIELKLFDLLSQNPTGLTTLEISRMLKLNYIENQSRCLQDVLDALYSMNFLDRQEDDGRYKLSKFTTDCFNPSEKYLSAVEKEFYPKMSHFYEQMADENLQQTIHELMLLRIQHLVDLSKYQRISIDQIALDAQVIILWRQENKLKQKISRAFDVLKADDQGVLILILPDDQDDEVTLTLNLFLNMASNNSEQIYQPDLFSEDSLKQIGFRTVEHVRSTDGLTLLLAYKWLR